MPPIAECNFVDPIFTLPDAGNPAVESTGIAVVPEAERAPFNNVLGCFKSLFKYACLFNSLRTIL